MNTTLSPNSIVNELSGLLTGDDIVPYIDHKVRQFCESIDLPIYPRDEYKDNNDITGLFFDDLHKDRNCFFYDLTNQSVDSVIALIEFIIGKKINNFRQYVSAVNFYSDLHYGSSDKDKTDLSVSIRNENGYVKLSVYDEKTERPISILLKIDNGIIYLESYGYYFKLELVNWDLFDGLFERFINTCHQRKIQEVSTVIGRSDVTSNYILNRNKMSIFDCIQETTKQLNVKDIVDLCDEFKFSEKVILNGSGQQCYKTYDYKNILMLTDSILNERDAFFIRQVISFSHFRYTLSNGKKLVYRFSFKNPSKYKLKYPYLYNLSIFEDNIGPMDGAIGDISIDIGDFENSTLLLGFFQAKEMGLTMPRKHRDEEPDMFFKLMKDSFKLEIAEKLEMSSTDLKTEHYILYEIMNFMGI